MAHKTFISYKYSEATKLRDKIILKLGDDAKYYKGEDGFSDDISSYKADTIKSYLKDMIFDTTVMIVIVSPNMLQSKWMEWEIQYALREQSRNGRTSHADGIVCVVHKDIAIAKFAPYGFYSQDAYGWAKSNGAWASWKLFYIINKNRGNKNKRGYNNLSDHYIDIVTEDQFLMDPVRYIDEAYTKSNNLDYYNIVKQGGDYIW